MWAAGPHGLTPLDDQQMVMPDEADQVWVRPHALAPWRADVVLNPDDEGQWVFRRDREYVVDLERVTWLQDGVRYLNPEVVLAFKAKRTRPKDEIDFDATGPLLAPTARSWLRDFLARIQPGHIWQTRL